MPTLPLPATWNQVLLSAVKLTATPPPQTARILAVFHTAIYDAWAAYHDRALATRTLVLMRRPEAERTRENRQKAISFAAYTVMDKYFTAKLTADGNELVHQTMMANLGHDHTDLSDDPSTPTGIGRRAALAVLDLRGGDGANTFKTLGGADFYADWTDYKAFHQPGTGLDLTDENCDRWQPLRSTLPDGTFKDQKFLVPHWGRVVPFALPDGSHFRPVLPPADGRSAQLLDEAKALLPFPPGRRTLRRHRRVLDGRPGSP